MSRSFDLKEGVRQQVPVLVGASGASGSGKTFSMLRLATGIQQVTGGDIAVIDTEARRALHYADMFKFQHLEFGEPFGSLDYLEAIRHCHKKGARIIIIDSLSHEHEGPGGLLSTHEAEVDRLGGDDYAKRERVKMLAWQKPKAARRAFINGLLQLDGAFLSCFRAKQTVKPVKVKGKLEMVQQGFIPIAGPEFVFEQTVNILLPPASGGVPDWSPEYTGEKQMLKLPVQFHELFKEKRPLDEEHGKALAEWARGGAEPAKGEQPAEEPAGEQAAETAGIIGEIKAEFQQHGPDLSDADKREVFHACFNTRKWSDIEKMDASALNDGLRYVRDHFAPKGESE